MKKVRILGLFLGFFLGLVMVTATPYFLVAVFSLIGMVLLAANIYIIICAIG